MSRALRPTTVVALVTALAVPAAFAERARTPQTGTAFIRVIGTVRLTVREAFAESKEERDVELGTGSGFVFTPFGHVLTNHHVIESSTIERRMGSAEVEAELSVDRIEVVFPSLGGARYEAIVEAVDPELDVAVLAVVGAELPYLALGDSAASDQGDDVRVLGFPFGAEVEIGKTSVADIVPRVSASTGAVSAVRADDDGGTAFLQTTATVNPGNSGGPMVDGDGYVLGVIRSKLREADGIGFAIPINAVKQFLSFNGYDPLLPVEAMRLSAPSPMPDKGVSLSFPDSLEDVSSTRVRIATDPGQGAIQFASDRLYTPWDLATLENAFLGGGVFGSFTADEQTELESPGAPGLSRVVGFAKGRDTTTGTEVTAVYSLVELGDEKVLSRYVGPRDNVAFNRSVLDASVDSVEAERFLRQPLVSELSIPPEGWSERALTAPDAPRVVVPTSWDMEVSAPFPCEGAPPTESALAVSPPGDFTVSFRVGWSGDAFADGASALRCGRRVVKPGEPYAYTLDYLGVRYVVEGVFVRSSGVVQLELVAPEGKHGFIRDLGRRWLDERAGLQLVSGDDVP